MAANVSLEVRLRRSVDAPRRARELLRDHFVTKLDSGELDRARLLASELVTNAVVHGTGAITLRADIAEDRLLVDVIDEGVLTDIEDGDCGVILDGDEGSRTTDDRSWTRER